MPILSLDALPLALIHQNREYFHQQPSSVAPGYDTHK